MNDRIHELLHRNLQEVFGEGDAARRRAAIDELYAEDCMLDVPPGTLVGREAVDKFAGDLRATHPHFVYTPHGEPQALLCSAKLFGRRLLPERSVLHVLKFMGVMHSARHAGRATVFALLDT
jgi:hypothetical protein